VVAGSLQWRCTVIDHFRDLPFDLRPATHPAQYTDVQLSGISRSF
jgi:hypothetical protein